MEFRNEKMKKNRFENGQQYIVFCLYTVSDLKEYSHSMTKTQVADL